MSLSRQDVLPRRILRSRLPQSQLCESCQLRVIYMYCMAGFYSGVGKQFVGCHSMRKMIGSPPSCQYGIAL